MLDDGTDMSRGELFIQWLKKQTIFNDETYNLRILHINPIFDNRQMINNLFERGNMI